MVVQWCEEGRGKEELERLFVGRWRVCQRAAITQVRLRLYFQEWKEQVKVLSRAPKPPHFDCHKPRSKLSFVVH